MSKPFLLRTSERSQHKRCQQAWHWAFNDKLKPKQEAPPLRFGSLVHKSLEAFYRPGLKRGPRPAITFERLYEAELKEAMGFGFRDEDGTWEDAGELGVAMMEHYFEEYGKDERYKVIATEYPFQVPVLSPKTGKVLFHYVGVLDGVWLDRSTKDKLVVDHKTTGTDPTKVKNLVLDEQASAYWTYGVEALFNAKILKPKDKLKGMIFNFMRKAKPDPRDRNALGQYLNQDHTVSKKQPSPYFHREVVWRDEVERERVRERVLNEVREIRLRRQGKLGIIKNPGPLHMPNCNGCGFRSMCELHEAGADWEALRDGTMRTWDPYDEHEIYDAR